jgi:hypothetical protein
MTADHPLAGLPEADVERILNGAPVDPEDGAA